jgi:hypothetical protein
LVESADAVYGCAFPLLGKGTRYCLIPALADGVETSYRERACWI